MGRREVSTGFWFGGPRGRDQWEDLGVDGIDRANWIRVAEDKVQWWAFVNAVMSLRVP
jgi:hypothetical protein